jgi:MSHA biogenesis protein MshG
MPQYKYSGRDNAGTLISGSIVAPSADDVAAQLFGDRVTPIDIKEVRENKKKASRPTSRKKIDLGPDASAIDKINAALSRNKVEVDELVMFARQMYSLTKAGLPLDRAIKGLEASLSNLVFRRILQDVIQLRR